MKKSIILALFFVSAIIASAQNNEAQLKSDLEKIIAHTKEMKMDKVMEMTYPPYVELLPEGGMAALASAALEGMGITTMYEDKPLNLKMSEILQLNNATVCMAEYDASSILEFKEKSMIDLFLNYPQPGQHVEKLGDNKIRMSGKVYLLGIKDAKTKNTWKYLNFDEDFLELDVARDVLSDEIINSAIKLKQSFQNK